MAQRGSGLDIELKCPRCGPHAALVEIQNDVGEARCTHCGGSHIKKAGMKKIFVELGGLSPRVLENLSGKKSKPGATRCPACQAFTVGIAVAHTSADVCARCVTAWFVPGALFTLSGARYGARTNAAIEPRGPAKRNTRQLPRSPLPPLKRRSSSGLLGFLLIAMPAIAVAGAGAAYYFMVHQKPPGPPDAPPEKKMVSLVPDDVLHSPDAASFGEHRFGGRTPKWWGERLTVLKARSDDRGRELYALTKQRAEANGLVVDESGAEISVKPSPQLITKIGARSGAR